MADKYWYSNGTCSNRYEINEILHRENGPAVEHTNGDKYWYLYGRSHREDGPASEYANGNKYWFIDGKRHRLDGPACERSDGIKMWFINGVILKYEEFENHPLRIKYLVDLEIMRLLNGQ
jgi:hypothetical protein